MMPDPHAQDRARFLLGSILIETRYALGHLYRKPPNIFARGFAATVINHERLTEVIGKLHEIMPDVQSGEALDWKALEQVGLTGEPLEWKADLIHPSLGRAKPKTQQTTVWPVPEVLTYPGGKPIWSPLFKYLKSLFESLISRAKSDSGVRLMLAFIGEFIECAEASLKFVQSGQVT
jgi:hypothetical protein